MENELISIKQSVNFRGKYSSEAVLFHLYFSIY